MDHPDLSLMPTEHVRSCLIARVASSPLLVCAPDQILSSDAATLHKFLAWLALSEMPRFLCSTSVRSCCPVLAQVIAQETSNVLLLFGTVQVCATLRELSIQLSGRLKSLTVLR